MAHCSAAFDCAAHSLDALLLLTVLYSSLGALLLLTVPDRKRGLCSDSRGRSDCPLLPSTLLRQIFTASYQSPEYLSFMAALQKFMITTFFLSACTGVGVLLWAAVAPSEERKKKILEQLPEANPEHMAETRRRNILVMQVIKEAAETNENVARKTPWSK